MEINNFEEITLKVAESMKRELTDVSYNTWLKPIETAYMQGNNIIIEVENNFSKSILEEKYLELISNTYSLVLPKSSHNKIIFKVAPKEVTNTISNANNTATTKLKPALESKRIADIKNEEKIQVDATIKKILSEIPEYIDIAASKGEYSTSYMSRYKCNKEVIEKLLEKLNEKGYTTQYIEDINTIRIQWK